VRLEALSDGKQYPVEIVRKADVFIVRIGEREYRVDYREPRESLYSLIINGKAFDIGVEKSGNGSYNIYFYDDFFKIEFADALQRQMLVSAADGATGKEEIVAPMSGKIVKLLKNKGDEVKANEGILIIQAMKMENELKASRNGTISQFLVKPGDTVNSSQLLAVIE